MSSMKVYIIFKMNFVWFVHEFVWHANRHRHTHQTPATVAAAAEQSWAVPSWAELASCVFSVSLAFFLFRIGITRCTRRDVMLIDVMRCWCMCVDVHCALMMMIAACGLDAVRLCSFFATTQRVSEASCRCPIRNASSIHMVSPFTYTSFGSVDISRCTRHHRVCYV